MQDATQHPPAFVAYTLKRSANDSAPFLATHRLFREVRGESMDNEIMENLVAPRLPKLDLPASTRYVTRTQLQALLVAVKSVKADADNELVLRSFSAMSDSLQTIVDALDHGNLSALEKSKDRDVHCKTIKGVEFITLQSEKKAPLASASTSSATTRTAVALVPRPFTQGVMQRTIETMARPPASDALHVPLKQLALDSVDQSTKGKGSVATTGDVDIKVRELSAVPDIKDCEVYVNIRKKAENASRATLRSTRFFEDMALLKSPESKVAAKAVLVENVQCDDPRVLSLIMRLQKRMETQKTAMARPLATNISQDPYAVTDWPRFFTEWTTPESFISLVKMVKDNADDALEMEKPAKQMRLSVAEALQRYPLQHNGWISILKRLQSEIHAAGESNKNLLHESKGVKSKIDPAKIRYLNEKLAMNSIVCPSHDCCFCHGVVRKIVRWFNESQRLVFDSRAQTPPLMLETKDATDAAGFEDLARNALIMIMAPFKHAAQLSREFLQDVTNPDTSLPRCVASLEKEQHVALAFTTTLFTLKAAPRYLDTDLFVKDSTAVREIEKESAFHDGRNVTVQPFAASWLADLRVAHNRRIDCSLAFYKLVTGNSLRTVDPFDCGEYATMASAYQLYLQCMTACQKELVSRVLADLSVGQEANMKSLDSCAARQATVLDDCKALLLTLQETKEKTIVEWRRAVRESRKKVRGEFVKADGRAALVHSVLLYVEALAAGVPAHTFDYKTTLETANRTLLAFFDKDGLLRVFHALVLRDHVPCNFEHIIEAIELPTSDEMTLYSGLLTSVVEHVFNNRPQHAVSDYEQFCSNVGMRKHEPMIRAILATATHSTLFHFCRHLPESTNRFTGLIDVLDKLALDAAAALVAS